MPSGTHAAMLPTLMLVIVCLSVLLWARRGLWRLAVLSLPGTLAHELAHLLVGTLLLARPNSLSLFPRRSGRSYVLGSVSFRSVGLLNGAFVAFAPLLLAPVGYLCVLQGSGAFIRGDYLAWSLWSVLAGNLFFSSLPSWQAGFQDRVSVAGDLLGGRGDRRGLGRESALIPGLVHWDPTKVSNVEGSRWAGRNLNETFREAIYRFPAIFGRTDAHSATFNLRPPVTEKPSRS